MSRILSIGLLGGAFAALATGCTDVESATELNPEGPPMVRQVFMNDVIINANNRPVSQPAIAFGDHPQFVATDDRVVTAGDAGRSNTLRVVVDELLIGNYVEQIACRPRADLGIGQTFQSVPEGTTPDDIARCAVANDLLADTCNGPHAVCIHTDGTPIGVLDEVPTGGDGASDDTQFIPGIIQVDCGGIDVPLDLQGTYWQPSGNQQVPAAGGFDSVGPAIIVAATDGFPTSSACTISFHDQIVDKDHISLCAPPNGGWVDGVLDESIDCASDGDTSEITWTTEPLRVDATSPANGATGVALVTGTTGEARGLVQFNVPLELDENLTVDPASIVLLEDGVERTDIHGLCPPLDGGAGPDVPCIQAADDPEDLTFRVPGGYLPDTTYMMTITTAVTDQFGVPLPENQVRTITWTTAP